MDVNSSNLFGEITKGLNLAKLVIACFSDEYVTSQNCELEFRFARESLKVPIVKAIVGTGNEWRRNELCLLSGTYTEVNFQYENKDAFPMLLRVVKDQLAAIKDAETEQRSKTPADSPQTDDDFNSHAFQELYELTQRKFLTEVIKIAGKMQTVRHYPRLFCVDLIEKHKLQALQDINSSNKEKAVSEISSSSTIVTELQPCIRALCEAEDGWHLSSTFVCLKEVKPQLCSYLARVMNILKSGNISNQLNVFSTEQGSQLIKDIENKSAAHDVDFSESFTQLRQLFIDEFESGNALSFDMFKGGQAKKMSLERCEMKNHKILWLCKAHVDLLGPKVLNESDKDTSDAALNQANNMILKELESIDMTEFDTPVTN